MSNEEQTKESQVKEAPDHLGLINARAKAYQLQIAKLKAGARSGISHTFGAAEDLLSDPVEVPEITKIDQCAISPGGPDERQWRAIFFTKQIVAHCVEMLKSHIDSCRIGEFGDELQRQSNEKPIAKVFDSALKEFACASLYLTALEQGVMDENAQSWFKEFFAICMSAADKLVPGPPVGAIMQNYETYEPKKLCQKMSSAIGRHLGFGEVGDRAWNNLRKINLCAGPKRLALLTHALTAPLAEIEKRLSQ